MKDDRQVFWTPQSAEAQNLAGLFGDTAAMWLYGVHSSLEARRRVGGSCGSGVDSQTGANVCKQHERCQTPSFRRAVVQRALVTW